MVVVIWVLTMAVAVSTVVTTAAEAVVEEATATGMAHVSGAHVPLAALKTIVC